MIFLFAPYLMLSAINSQRPSVITKELPTPGRIAYIRKGDLFLRDLSHGRLRRLTQDRRNSAPHWSPDGKWIAFNKVDTTRRDTSRLWLIRWDGAEAHKVDTVASFVSWSPGGDLLYQRNGALFLAQPEQSHHPRCLVRKPPGKTSDISQSCWSLDGKRLAYEIRSLRFRTDAGARCYSYQIRCVDKRTNWDTLIQRTQGENGLFLSKWSPDGKRLVLFWDGEDTDMVGYIGAVPLYADGLPIRDISLAKRRKGRPVSRLLSRTEPGETDSYQNDVLCGDKNLASSPDGKRLVIGSGQGRHNLKDKWLTMVNYRTLSYHRVTSWGMYAVEPVWSPDGRHIAYLGDSTISTHPYLPGPSLWCMTGDGQRKWSVLGTQGEDEECWQPRWLADSKHIVFSRGEEKNAIPWMVDLSGKHLHRIAPTDTMEWDLWAGK